ncbi:MAG: S8 family serine peptidase [Actinophytocola sp.]|nr:S8 family serine peptidase [Actinophytocola sp.]
MAAADQDSSKPQIAQAQSDSAIKGSYIVVFEDGVSASSVGNKARAHAQRYDADVTHTYTTALRGYAATMNQRAAERIADNPAVAYVEQDQRVQLTDDQSNPPWGLDRIDQRDLPLNDLYSYSTTASNVDAYVIDTGIRTSHNDFGGRATSGYDAVDGGAANDCNGHGTHVAGTVGGGTYGVAKQVNLIAVRVLDCNGSGSNSGVIAGVDWVTNNASGPSVANMSLGGGASSALDDAVRNSINSGVTYAVASGNGDFFGRPQDACGYSPARVGEALTVNASNSSDSAASFSNYGACTDLYAPGVDVTSAWIGSDSDTNTISGTSMAAPHVAGAAALYLADHTSASPSQVHAAIVDNASTGKISGVPSSDTPNRLLYTGSGGSTPPPDPDPTGCTGTNDTNVNIPDGGTASSPITISDCGRKASSSSTITVDIKHTYRGDLVIDLIAPNGTAYRLKNSSYWDSADNVQGSVNRDLSSHDADGTWTLRVQDVYSGDTGYIDSWQLEL